MCILGVFRIQCAHLAKHERVVRNWFPVRRSSSPLMPQRIPYTHTLSGVFVLLAQMDAEWRSVVGKNFIHPRPRGDIQAHTKHRESNFSLFAPRVKISWRAYRALGVFKLLPILGGLVRKERG
jgi:hypothetical protein